MKCTRKYDKVGQAGPRIPFRSSYPHNKQIISSLSRQWILLLGWVETTSTSSWTSLYRVYHEFVQATSSRVLDQRERKHEHRKNCETWSLWVSLSSQIQSIEEELPPHSELCRGDSCVRLNRSCIIYEISLLTNVIPGTRCLMIDDVEEISYTLTVRHSSVLAEVSESILV